MSYWMESEVQGFGDPYPISVKKVPGGAGWGPIAGTPYLRFLRCEKSRRRDLAQAGSNLASASCPEAPLVQRTSDLPPPFCCLLAGLRSLLQCCRPSFSSTSKKSCIGSSRTSRSIFRHSSAACVVSAIRGPRPTCSMRSLRGVDCCILCQSQRAAPADAHDARFLAAVGFGQLLQGPG